MTRLILSLAVSLCSIYALTAQTGDIYHVNSKTLNLRSSPTKDSKAIKQLSKYDNVSLLEDIQDKDWVKVRYKEDQGYVATHLISQGEAVVTFQTVRVGAICKDGTSSKATGRGACSHHGGVSRWKTKRKQSVTIIENQ